MFGNVGSPWILQKAQTIYEYCMDVYDLYGICFMIYTVYDLYDVEICTDFWNM